MKDKLLKNTFLSLPTVSVSLLNSDLANLSSTIKKLASAGVEVIHLDVMDGHFVPNLTFGAPVVKCLRKYTKCIFDVHLMIDNPEKYYLDYINAGADVIVFHYESVDRKKITKLIKDIKSKGIFCGVSIKPATDVYKIFPYLDIIDLVLVMTVEPGFGGQNIIESCLSKIVLLNEYRDKKKLNFVISCDGGINEENIEKVIRLGCDMPVVGNAIFSSKDFVKKTRFFILLTKKYKFRINKKLCYGKESC